MKHFNFLSVVIALVLVASVGCTTMRSTEDDYYDRQPAANNRVYVDDPYRGTVVLERDPYTGRYYEVNSVGTYNNRVYRSYGNSTYGRNSRSYGNSRGGNYRNDNYRNDTYRNNGRVNQNAQRPSVEEQRRTEQQSKEEARKKILGN